MGMGRGRGKRGGEDEIGVGVVGEYIVDCRVVVGCGGCCWWW